MGYFFEWALSEVFDVDENTDQEAAFTEAEDALEWLRGLFEDEPEQNEIPFDPYFKIFWKILSTGFFI